MKQLTAILLAVALVAAFTFVSGCTGTNTGDVTHLRIGYQPSTHQVAHVTAMEKDGGRRTSHPSASRR